MVDYVQLNEEMRKKMIMERIEYYERQRYALELNKAEDPETEVDEALADADRRITVLRDLLHEMRAPKKAKKP